MSKHRKEANAQICLKVKTIYTFTTFKRNSYDCHPSSYATRGKPAAIANFCTLYQIYEPKDNRNAKYYFGSSMITVKSYTNLIGTMLDMPAKYYIFTKNNDISFGFWEI